MKALVITQRSPDITQLLRKTASQADHISVITNTLKFIHRLLPIASLDDDVKERISALILDIISLKIFRFCFGSSSVSSSAYEAALELLLVLQFKDATKAIEMAKMRRKAEATKVHVCV